MGRSWKRGSPGWCSRLLRTIGRNPSYRMSFRTVAVALTVALVLTACDSGRTDNEDQPRTAPSIRDLRTEQTTGPYVSVAVDNHFHDVHPEDGIRIAADRPFVFKNQGRNLHNVTVRSAGGDVWML